MVQSNVRPPPVAQDPLGLKLPCVSPPTCTAAPSTHVAAGLGLSGCCSVHTQVGRWFAFKDRDAKFTVECRAGFITFLMVSYVLAVNPNILITTGGTCNPQEVCTVRSYDAAPAVLVQLVNLAVADCCSTWSCQQSAAWLYKLWVWCAAGLWRIALSLP